MVNIFLKMIKADYLGKFVVNLTFYNGESAQLDLEPELWG